MFDTAHPELNRAYSTDSDIAFAAMNNLFAETDLDETPFSDAESTLPAMTPVSECPRLVASEEYSETHLGNAKHNVHVSQV